MKSPSAKVFSNPAELRFSPRAGFDLPVEIFTGDFGGSLSGRTRDIGISGACVATASPFAVKSISRLVLMLPGGPLELEAEGVWQNALPNDDVVMTGISFVDTPDDTVSVLWDLVLDAAKDFARFIHTDSEISGVGVEGAMGLAQVTRMRRLNAGSVLYRQGPAGEAERSLFLIDQGSVAVEVRVRDALSRPLGRLGRGALVGGLPLISGCDHPETAVAETDAQLLEIDTSAYHYISRSKPWLAQLLCQAITFSYAQRLSNMLSRVRDDL